MPEGRFITFEGGEGTGKSTHVQRLAEALRQGGREIVITREPGGTQGAEAIRDLLVTGDSARWTPLSEALLNYAARADHLARVIRPALARGAWVVCDRFLDSTRAYQGAGGGVDSGLLAALQDAVVGATIPDLTLILDIDVDAGLARANNRIDRSGNGEHRFEDKGRDFHARLRQAFLDIAAREPSRCAVIDTSASPDEVADAIWECVASRLAP
jgi:dTMP kinase